MAADYLFHQRQRRNNNPAWAWDFRNKQPELYARQTPIEPQTRLLPDRAPGARRAASYAYELAYRRYQPLESTEDTPVAGSLGAATQGRRDLPNRAPGARPNRQAYQLRPFTIEGFAEDQELLHERRRIPDRTARTLRAAPDAYRLSAFQIDLFDGEDELLANRHAVTQRAPGPRRAPADAYDLAAFEVDLYAGSDNSQTRPQGQALLPDRQIVEDRAQYPERRQRRKVLPGRSEALALLPDTAELFGGRALLPSQAPGPRRADRTSYGLQNNPADLYAPAAPSEFEELLGSRHLLPSRAPGAPRAAREAYGVVNNPVDLFAPAVIAENNELYVGRQQFPDRVAPARRRFRRKVYPGGARAVQEAEGQALLPLRAPARPRAANEAYQIDVFPIDFFAALTPAEFTTRLLPDRAFPARRASADAYALAPSLVELYAGLLPEELTHILLPARAPGRPRAANRAYELRSSDPAFLGIFVPPVVKPRRLLLGVGL